MTTPRAAVVNRSHISALPWVARRNQVRVLLVNALAGHVERVGDLLPGPAVAAGVGDLQMLKPLKQAAQRHDSAEPNPRISTAGRRGEVGCLSHAVNLR